ncbi:N-6 DNA methylase [Lactobacillus sp. PV034]|uniref:N-6 DNA methylase n=1 Tax=Lactobacillus sp. PV034 TaxID=2594495 RepID=UPI00224086FA|nr:N-6 DNA methylase [Lactobacillus sp. PV034]
MKNKEEYVWKVMNQLRGRTSLFNSVILISNFIFYRYISEHKVSLNLKFSQQSNFQTIVDETKKGKLTIVELQSALNTVETASKNLNGIFQNLNLNSVEYGNSTDERISLFKEALLLVNTLEFTEISYGKFFEILFEKYIAKSVITSTAKSISNVVAKLLITNNKNETMTIYDSTIGTGNMIVNFLDNLDTTKVSIIGDEINPALYNIAKMNLIIHDLKLNQFTIKNINSLEEKWNGKGNADFVSLDPPYSAKWDANPELLKDLRFKKYGVLPPKSKADYAFLLQGLAHLKESGTMAIVLPHGVLFRSAKERKIRQKLLEDGNIEAVIGLPSNLSYNTAIPLIIIILKKNRNDKNVFFIDASQEYEKGRLINALNNQEIKKIVDTYKNKTEIKNYSHLATWDEIKKNDFNLNISRYISPFDESKLPSLQESNFKLKEIQEKIKKDNKELVSALEQIDSKCDNEELKRLIDLIKVK